MLNELQKAQGYKISNRHVITPINPQRLDQLKAHSLNNHFDSDTASGDKASKRANIKHYLERIRPVKHAESTTTVHIAPNSVASTVETIGPKDSPFQNSLGVNVELPSEKISNSAGVINNAFVTPKDGYFHIVPKGTFSHPSGINQVLDDEALDSMINSFNKDKATNPDFKILLDYDHRSQLPASENGTTEAAGWITDLQKRSDGIYANIAFSTGGDAAVKGGKWRAVSPVWTKGNCSIVNGDKNMLRPSKISEVGLTNDNNLPVHSLTQIV